MSAAEQFLVNFNLHAVALLDGLQKIYHGRKKVTEYLEKEKGQLMDALEGSITRTIPIMRFLKLLETPFEYKGKEYDIAETVTLCALTPDQLSDLEYMSEEEALMQRAMIMKDIMERDIPTSGPNIDVCLRFLEDRVLDDCPYFNLIANYTTKFGKENQVWLIKQCMVVVSLAASWKGMEGDATLTARMGEMGDALKGLLGK